MPERVDLVKGCPGGEVTASEPRRSTAVRGWLLAFRPPTVEFELNAESKIPLERPNGHRRAWHSAPHVFEFARAQLGVSRRRGDATMAEVVLDNTQVEAGIDQRVAARVPEHI
jgi:hypothetical protein